MSSAAIISPSLALAISNGGNQFGTPIVIGSTDASAVSIVTGGTAAISIDTSQNVTVAGTLTATGGFTPSGIVSLSNGTAAAPSLTFASDADTGIYRVGANQVGIAAGGVIAMSIAAAGNTFVGTVAFPDGTAALPAMTFTNAGSTGVYKSGSGAIGLATNGTAALTINNAQAATFTGAVAVTGLATFAAGTVGAPSIAFTTDTDTGIYVGAANNIGIAAGGALAMEIKGLDIVCGNAAIATSATSGFFWAPGCAGAATGTPANTFPGRVPLVFDTTNGRLYAYYGGAWKYAAVAT